METGSSIPASSQVPSGGQNRLSLILASLVVIRRLIAAFMLFIDFPRFALLWYNMHEVIPKARDVPR
jgi:hypothetical protein